jgi:uncharacterized protein (TIGR02246 family)
MHAGPLLLSTIYASHGPTPFTLGVEALLPLLLTASSGQSLFRGGCSMPKRTRNAYVLLILVPLVFGPGTPASSKDSAGQLSTEDEKAIRATIERYRSAWLANDAKGVLQTFTDDAVLLPAHGAAAVSGIAAIEKYWFTAGGPPTTITRLDITFDQISGNATLAFSRGQDNVGWTVTQDGVTHRHYHPGTYLDVMKKLPDGGWRIQVHMWDDGPEQVD